MSTRLFFILLLNYFFSYSCGLRTQMDHLLNVLCTLNLHPAIRRILSNLFILWRYILRKMCPYSEFLWSVFSCIRTEYGAVQMREDRDQKNSEYGYFSRSDIKGKADHSAVSFCDKCWHLWQLQFSKRAIVKEHR